MASNCCTIDGYIIDPNDEPMAIRIEWDTPPPAIMAKVLDDPKAWAFLLNKDRHEQWHPSGVILHRLEGNDTNPPGGIRIGVGFGGRILCQGSIHHITPIA